MKRLIKHLIPVGLASSMALMLAGVINTCENECKKITHFSNISYQQAIAEIKTPEEAEWYVTSYIHPSLKYAHVANSFKVTHKTREGDCSEATVAAAALLSDNGYSPIWLFLHNTGEKVGHGVFVYKENGKWGTIGINDVDNSPPKYNNLENIARDLGFEEYALDRIRDDIIPNWISTDRSLYLTKGESARIRNQPLKKVRHFTVK